MHRQEKLLRQETLINTDKHQVCVSFKSFTYLQECPSILNRITFKIAKLKVLGELKNKPKYIPINAIYAYIFLFYPKY